MARPKDMPELVPMYSSNVRAAGYDPYFKMLYVRFWAHKRGQKHPLYRYDDVPRNIWTRFQKVASKGKFVWRNIRDRYSYEKWNGNRWESDVLLGVRQQRKRKIKKRLATRKKARAKRRG